MVSIKSQAILSVLGLIVVSINDRYLRWPGLSLVLIKRQASLGGPGLISGVDQEVVSVSCVCLT